METERERGREQEREGEIMMTNADFGTTLRCRMLADRGNDTVVVESMT